MKTSAAIDLKKDRSCLSTFLAAGEEVTGIAKEAAWTGRSRRAISLPNKKKDVLQHWDKKAAFYSLGQHIPHL